jgi:hypothetical protein
VHVCNTLEQQCILMLRIAPVLLTGVNTIAMSHLPRKTSGACTSSHSISSTHSGPNETAAVEPTVLNAALIVAKITKQNPGYSVAARRVTLNQLLLLSYSKFQYSKQHVALCQ